MSPPEVVFSEYKVGQVYEARLYESIMGVRGGLEETSLESLLGITRLLIWRSVLLC